MSTIAVSQTDNIWDEYVLDSASDTLTNEKAVVGSFEAGSIADFLAGTTNLDGYVSFINAANVTVWTQTIRTTNDDVAIGVSLGGDGNIYVTGAYRGTATFSSSNGTNFTLNNIPISNTQRTAFLASYTRAGVLRWAVRDGGQNDDAGMSVACTSDGVVVIGSYVNRSAVLQGSAPPLRLNNTNNDFYIAKYSFSGTPMWFRTGGGPNADYSYTLPFESQHYSVVTSDDKIYLSGSVSGTTLTLSGLGGATSGTTTASIGGGQEDVFLLKLSNTGQVEWLRGIEHGNGPGQSNLAVDCSGLYVGGLAYENLTLPGQANIDLAANQEIYLAKINVLNGDVLWSQIIASTDNNTETIRDVYSDSKGSVFVIGDYRDVLSVGSVSIPDASSLAAFLIRFNSNGVAQSSLTLNGNEFDYATAISPASSGQLLVYGYSNSDLDGNQSGLNNSDDIFGWNVDYTVVNLLNCCAIVNQPGTASILPSSVVCPGANITLSATGTSSTPTWEQSTDGVTFSSASLSGNIVSVTVNAPLFYRARVSSPGCGETFSNIVSVTLVPAPVFNCITTTQQIEATTCTAEMPNYIPTTLPNVCSVYTFQQSIAAGTALPLGTHPVTITDWQGNVVCSFSVVVIETTPPIITCPASLPALISPATGPCGRAMPDFRNLLTLVDDCAANLTVSQVPSPGTFITASTTVVFTVTDQGGNTASCSLPLAFSDTTAPVISTCPGSRTGNLLANCTFIVPDYTPLAVASDNCSSVTFTQLPASGTIISASTSITLTATDLSGNSSTCTFTLTLQDVTPPTISSCPTSFTEALTPSCSIVVGDYRSFISVTDLCSPSFSTIQTPAPGTVVNPPANVSVTFSDGAGNNSTCNFTVIGDTSPIPSVLNCPVLPTAELDATCQAYVPDFLATLQLSTGCFPSANLLQSPAPGSAFTAPVNVVISYSNVSICNFVLTPVDNVPPEISGCPPDILEAFSTECTFEIPSYIPLLTVTDDCSTTFLFTQQPAAGTIVTASTPIVIRATDDGGNSSQCEFNLLLSDTLSPTITLCPTGLSEPLNASCTITLGDYTSALQVTDNCTSALTITQTPAVGFSAEAPIVVTLEATDSSGNSSSCSFPVTAIPQTVPVPNSCLPNQIIFAGTHCTAIVPDFAPLLAFDTWCGPTPELNQWPAPGTTISTSRTVVLRYDEIVLCSFILILSDTLAPSIFNCPTSLNETLPESCAYTIPDYTTFITATDNCSEIVSWIQTPPTGTEVSSSTTILLTAIDEVGNASQCSFVLTLQDQSPPVITDCPSVVILPADSLCAAVVPDFTSQLTITDNCSSIVLITQNPLPGTSITTSTEVLITAYNANDQFTECSFTLVIEDTIAPNLLCPATISIPSNTECTFAIPDLESLLTITDNCSSTFNLEQTPSVGSIAQGNQIVAIEVTDAGNNTSTCSILLETVDVTAPEIVLCPPTQIRDLTNCVYTLEDLSPLLNFSDACDNTPTVTQQPAIGTVFSQDQSPFSVVLRVTDLSGNFSECTIEIQLNEPSLPSIACPSSAVFQVSSSSCEATVTIDEPEVSINCGTYTLSNSFLATNSFTLEQAPGLYSATYILTDEYGQTATCTTTWTVADTIAPIVDCTPAIEVLLGEGSCIALVDIPEALYTDNCSIATTDSTLPTGSNILTAGTYQITYSATDSSGNTSTCETELLVLDLIAPEVSCADTLTILSSSEFCGALLPLTAPTVEENCDVALITSNLGWIAGSPNYFDVGSTVFEWIVTDLSGNTGTCTTIVEVIDETSPVVVCEEFVELQLLEPGCLLTTDLPLPAATDNCGIASILPNLPGNSPYTLPVGETPVEFTIQDIHDNSSSCTTIFYVIELEAPTLECPESVTIPTDMGLCTAQFPISTPLVTDNCSATFVFTNSITGTSLPPQSFNLGVTTITFSAVDESGNAGSCTTLVTVVDGGIPEITCPGNSSICSTQLELEEPIVFDLCGSVSWEQTDGLPSGSLVTPGDYLIEYTAFDTQNNSSSCTYTLTIIPPQPIGFNIPTTSICANEASFSVEAFIQSDLPVTPSTNLPNFIFDPATSEIGWNILEVTAGTSNCLSSAIDSIFVNALPSLVLTAPSIQCGLEANFTIENNGGSLVILPNNNYTISFLGGSAYSINADLEGVYLIEAISVSPDICEVNASVSIELVSDPSEPDAGPDQLLTQSYSTTLAGSCFNPDSLYWFSPGSAQFSSITSLTTEVTGLVDGTNILYLFNDSGPCGLAVDSVVITVDIAVMPNGFSPNGDGVNDFFVIPETENNESSLSIFNRWGKKIWSTSAYINQWNGVDESGEDLPDDTYFYEWVQNAEVRTGFIIIKR
jgi:gliding motility-associated-like protein